MDHARITSARCPLNPKRSLDAQSEPRETSAVNLFEVATAYDDATQTESESDDAHMIKSKQPSNVTLTHRTGSRDFPLPTTSYNTAFMSKSTATDTIPPRVAAGHDGVDYHIDVIVSSDTDADQHQPSRGYERQAGHAATQARMHTVAATQLSAEDSPMRPLLQSLQLSSISSLSSSSAHTLIQDRIHKQLHQPEQHHPLSHAQRQQSLQQQQQQQQSQTSTSALPMRSHSACLQRTQSQQQHPSTM
jgi:hypothetical protein